MRVSELLELLAEFPEYYEVKAAGNFVTEVHSEMHAVGEQYRGGETSLDEVAVVVVIE